MRTYSVQVGNVLESQAEDTVNGVVVEEAGKAGDSGERLAGGLDTGNSD